MKNLIFSLLIIISLNSIAGAPFLTVGNGGSCDANSIQEAIDSNLSNIIRIASDKVYFESLTIDDRDIVLTGGYADCSAAEANITDLSIALLNGGGSDPVVLVTGNNQIRNIDLRFLQLANGAVGLASTADVNLSVSDVTLISNNTYGSLFIGGDQNIMFGDVTVNSNQGSGMACSGDEVSVRFEGDSVISQNVSPAVGGGLFISDGCNANVLSPTVINNNEAASHGGGVAVTNGSLVNLTGIQINNNQADSDGNNSGDGGGLYVDGEFSIVNAVNVKFEGNSASKGGAVAAADNGSFTNYAANTVSNPCNTPGECTSYTGNYVTSFGGVFYASTEARILAMHAQIRGTGAPASGLVALANGGAHIEIEGSMIVKNGGEDLPADDLFNIAGLLDNTTRITLDHVTIADNELTDSVIRNSNGNFTLKSSIVREEVDVSSEINSVSHTFECAIVNETDSFSAGGTVIVDDPQFMGTSNYHIKPTSPAIDYCYGAASLTVELGYDIDFEGRDYDDPNVDNLHGTFDIGADEYRWDNDLIFMNGFEQE